MILEKNVTYEEIDMDFAEILTRNDFHKLINHYGYEVGVEIGVGAGVNSMYLMDNSQIKLLHGVENWSVRGPKKRQDLTKEELKAYGDRFNLIEMNSRKAAALFEDESLDFVYIDGDHRYKGVKADIELWYPKVRKGGFFGGHDYVVARRCGVIQAVDEYFENIGREFFVTQEPDGDPVNRSFWMIK
jgi:hypothetical protein